MAPRSLSPQVCPETADTSSTPRASRGSGSLALVYVPSQRTVTLDLRVLDTPQVTVDLLDPTTADTRRVGDWPTDQTVQVDTPSANAAGDDDWVIVVQPT
jgi:hypothetical protein